MDVDPNEITDIIPFNEFGRLDELEFSDNILFDTEVEVLRAPELDDLTDTDDLTPLPLATPGECPPDPPARESATYVHAAAIAPRRGAHRQQLNGAVKGRVLISAMAAGAAAAAAHSAAHPTDPGKAHAVRAADAAMLHRGPITASSHGVQMVTVQPAATTAVHNAQLASAVAFAEERAQREARLQQPLYVMPARGLLTSNFGYRWGVLHAGIDIANAIGTPIVAVSDGVVIDAGPTAGYGMWVKLRHADGTVTLYGHVNTTTVRVGERVMAGDQIATMGNRGNSTGPHLHFEVLAGGSARVDPVPWLAKRGLSLGGFAG
ncbi:M23 family metallopeptidase [Mycobacterium sp.]|uniref:M23 family metallopeptidase n=1 Tax=Mycobacterium sp. TaxID=1785 RepID=UPI0025DFA873|nr:M23 family metallopeptidase [Mycobacterium sp.]